MRHALAVPRRARLDIPGYPFHVVMRGVDRRTCFLIEPDFACYRKWLFEYAALHGCEVHAFVQMTNHVHVLLTGAKERAISVTMQAVGRRYVRYFNDRHKRTGPLFEGRFRSSLVDSDEYVLACIRYIDLNPVRAGMVADATTYRWSSCAAHALQSPLPGWSPHAVYLALARRLNDRAAAYRCLLEQPLSDAVVEELRWRTAHPSAAPCVPGSDSSFVPESVPESDP